MGACMAHLMIVYTKSPVEHRLCQCLLDWLVFHLRAFSLYSMLLDTVLSLACDPRVLPYHLFELADYLFMFGCIVFDLASPAVTTSRARHNLDI